MRLNRRKNRDSARRRKRVSEGAPETSAGDSPKGRDERRRSLAGAVSSLRSREGGSKRPARQISVPPALRSFAADALGVARELLRWPARIWMAVAEALGALFLKVWLRALLPALRVGWRVLRAGLAVGQRTVTPSRGLAVVAVAAAIALGGSQFGDYRAVQVGAPEYAEVSDVAQPPEVDRSSPRSAHGVWVFAIAVGCLFVTFFAVWRNWRLARLLLFAGVAVVAISLFIDRPEGLELGATAEQYVGVHAVLLGPFWVQLFAGATLAVVGPLLAAQLRGERAGQRRPGARVRGDNGEVEAKRAPRLRPGVGT
jgi:hypothetical protein